MNRQQCTTLLRLWLRHHRGSICLYLIGVALTLGVFLLYGLPMEPFFYVLLLLTAICGVAAVISLFRGAAQLRQFRGIETRIRQGVFSLSELLPALPPDTIAEASYRELISDLGEKLLEEADRAAEKEQDLLDYYTAWVHQIKTPIAVMRLLLNTEDSDEHRALQSELFRIEQYVEMVLQFIRLESTTNDLVLQEYDLDDLIRQSVHKFAAQFVGRRLTLRFNPTGYRLVTDRKWFCFMLDQLLSNAIKYTPQGGITITLEEERLCIADTGIGIAPQDLPRIFEKGYTGINGRTEQHASGLGLYLCKQAADRLRIPISAESEPGRGTVFSLQLHQEHLLRD